MEEINILVKQIEGTLKILDKIQGLSGLKKGAWNNVLVQGRLEMKELGEFKDAFEKHAKEDKFNDMDDFDTDIKKFIKYIENAEDGGRIIGLAETYQTKHQSDKSGTSWKDGKKKLEELEELEDMYSTLEVEANELDDLQDANNDLTKKKFKEANGTYKILKTYIRKYLTNAKKLKTIPTGKSKYPWDDLKDELLSHKAYLKEAIGDLKDADTASEMKTVFNKYAGLYEDETLKLIGQIEGIKVKTRKVKKTDEQKIWAYAKMMLKTTSDALYESYRHMRDAAKSI